MYLLVGLGNPGSKYKKNRHNVGYLTVDIIAKKYDFIKKGRNKFGDVFEGKISNSSFDIFNDSTRVKCLRCVFHLQYFSR